MQPRFHCLDKGVHFIWFFRLEQDGYPSGRSRDLTISPTGPTDFPLVDAALTDQSGRYDKRFPEEGPLIFGIRYLYARDTALAGVLLEAGGDCTLSSVEVFPANQETPLFILAEVIKRETTEDRDALSGKVFWYKFTPSTREAIEIESKNAHVRALYPRKETDPSPGTLLFRGEGTGQAAVISIEGRLLGATIPGVKIRESSYDLRPDQYLLAQERSRLPDSPADLLAGIWRDQRELLQHIDSLLGRIEMPPIASQKVLSALPKDSEPFGALAEDQQNVWQAVVKQVEIVDDAAGSHERAKYFTSEDLLRGEVDIEEHTLTATLDLFERMGVIVRVTVPDPETREIQARYRRITQRDLWEGDFIE